MKRESDQKTEINNFQVNLSFRFLTKKLRKKLYLTRISRKRNKGLKNLYLIADEQHREEIAEYEINNTQVIRFLKASKLEFNFLEEARPKVRESDRETYMILQQETKQMNYSKWISREKGREEFREFYRTDDQKDQEIVECEINNFQSIWLNFLGKVRESGSLLIGSKEGQLWMWERNSDDYIL